MFSPSDHLKLAKDLDIWIGFFSAPSVPLISPTCWTLNLQRLHGFAYALPEGL